MRNPIVRLVLALLALAAAGGAGYYVFTLEQRAAALRNAERSFGEDVLRLQATLADLRAAEAGYLAIGQDAAVWIGKAAQLRQQADGQLKRLAAPTPDLDADLATVGEGLASLGRFDEQIRELLRQEETLAASALVFNDSAQVIAATSAALSRVRGAGASKTGSAVTELRRQQLYAAAGGGLVVLLVLLLLVPARRPVAGQPGEDEYVSAVASDTTLFAPVPQPPAPHVGVGADLDLALERRSNRGHEIDGDWAGEPRESKTGAWGDFAPRREADPVDDLDIALTPAADVSQPAAPTARHESGGGREPEGGDISPTVDLSAAAQLCTDLARVRDTSELQGLLARAAALLDASGIVVWMGGSDGNVLWPAFSHGYTPHTLSKMQALPRNGGTPVSAAFRSGLMEVVPADGATSGAIVAPILGSNGCAGVMAVEIRHGAETDGAEQALAGIIAAQLATLVAGEGQ
jgi:hypothetical protein